MKDKTRETFELFIEKANLLEEKTFVKNSIANGLNLNIQFGSPRQIKHNISDREFIESVVVTVRMFYQDNDRISFRKIASLLSDPSLSQTFIAFFNERRKELNVYLDSFGEIQGVWDGKELTNRNIFDTFVYGDIAHTNEEKRAVYLKWKELGTLFILIEYLFVRILMDVVLLIVEVADAMKLELAGKKIVYT